MPPFRTAAALGALLAATPALAQHQGHDMGGRARPGMAMPAGEPAALEPLYAGGPRGAMAFIRLKID